MFGVKHLQKKFRDCIAGRALSRRARPHSRFPVFLDSCPHPACSLREQADLPTAWGGEGAARPSP